MYVFKYLRLLHCNGYFQRNRSRNDCYRGNDDNISHAIREKKYKKKYAVHSEFLFSLSIFNLLLFYFLVSVVPMVDQARSGADPHQFPPFYENRSDFFIINIFLITRNFPS